MSDIDYATSLRSLAIGLENGGSPVTAEIMRNAADELDRLRARIQELLATIVRVTNETPFSDEAKDALEQRGKLIAEVGTLKAKIAALNVAAVDEHTEREVLRAENERLAAVCEQWELDYTAAMADWRRALTERDSALASADRMRGVLTLVRDDFDQAIAAHDSSDPRHPSHGGQHHNGPCCEFGNLTPGSVRHMRWLRDVIDAATKEKT